MKRQSLWGDWTLLEAGSEEAITAQLPGCNYLALVSAGALENPFWGTNETQAKVVAEKAWQYQRQFTVDKALLQQGSVDLVLNGVDTFAAIYLNSQLVGETENAHRTWRFPVKQSLVAGENLIQIRFKSPLAYIRERQGKAPLAGANMGEDGVGYVRKPAYHFGWDWGPTLPPAGVTGEITLEAYTNARFTDIRIEQRHQDGNVLLEVAAKGECPQGMRVACQLIGPDGQGQAEAQSPFPGQANLTLAVARPQLWWCNGLGQQPLYTVTLKLLDSTDTVVDEWMRTIGLRTIELDTSADQWGNTFRFLINGVPIFAKGANWIPSDSFIPRTTKQDLAFYLEGAAHANMNMIRVWGGGYYESDDFYDLCDQYGLLVWQDFAFACVSYPFHEPAFIANVKAEVQDNVSRLRHHASLALWCGNNELQMFPQLRKRSKELAAAEDRFFYETLPAWVAGLDSRPYWPGSPNSGTPGEKGNLWDKGDTHLWEVWHGLYPIEAFRDIPTRFCSEFGMESLPSMQAIRSFTDETDLDVLSPVLKAHQKAVLGNEKMLYYLLAKYRNPAKFEDNIYLSQIVQAETIRVATEQWRQKTGRCNGALYWQLNDCWPVCSWASIDYEKQYKALQYRARHFNKMAIVSVDMRETDCDIYVVNDYPSQLAGVVEWELKDFGGKTIDKGSKAVQVAPTCAQRQATIHFTEKLHGHAMAGAYLAVRLLQNGEAVSASTQLLVPDRDADLRRPTVDVRVAYENGSALVTIRSDTFARYAYVEVEGAAGPLSDNYIDLEPNTEYRLTCPVANPPAAVRVHTLADVEPQGTPQNDRRIRKRIRRTMPHPLFILAYKYLLK